MNRPLTIRLLLACGAIGPLLFIIAFFIEGAMRPGYSAWHDFVSSLSLSNQGWMQILNFIVCGFLMLGFALGLRLPLQGGKGATWGPLLLGVFGLGLIAAGLFVPDPNLGYPPGVPSTWPRPQTLHGALHGVAFLVVCSSLVAANMVLARRFAGDPAWRSWASYSIVTAVLVAVFAIGLLVLSAADAQGAISNAPVGLLNIMLVIIGWGWIALFALRLLSKRTGSASAPHDAVGTDTAGRT